MKRIPVVLGVMIVVLAGCGGDPEPEASASVVREAKAAKAAAADPITRMARAVGGGKPGASVEIKYEFLAKPEVGKPVEVDLVLIPNAGVSALDITISGMDGVSLTGALSQSFSDAKQGEPYKHRFSLLAERNGVFYVTVVATTHIGAATMGRTFSIPFVVGTPQAQEKTTAPPTTTDTNGQPVQAAPAVETTT